LNAYSLSCALFPRDFRNDLSNSSDQRIRHLIAVIVNDPNILGGKPVFRGTRVPFKVNQFLEEYPSVSRELSIAAIEEARMSLVSQLI
jgi:uncharacterized protein (DUF433 family)